MKLPDTWWNYSDIYECRNLSVLNQKWDVKTVSADRNFVTNTFGCGGRLKKAKLNSGGDWNASRDQPGYVPITSQD